MNQSLDPVLYAQALNIIEASAAEKKDLNVRLEQFFIRLLKKNKFSDNEIKNWEKCNLNRITFQKNIA